jgi:hypothetical protein
MNTRKIAAEYRLAHWAQIMREKKESGLSIKAFCERAGFHENVYFYWQRKLREAVCEQIVEIRGEMPPTAALTPRGFAEVKLADPPQQLACRGKARYSEIRVEVAGMLITADDAYPASQLSELLRGLMMPC